MNALWEVAEETSELSPRARNDMCSAFKIEERGPVEYAVYVCGSVLFKTWSDILILASAVVFPDELRKELSYWRSQSISCLEDEIRTIAKVGLGMPLNRDQSLQYQLHSAYGTLAVMIGRSANSIRASSLFLCGAALSRIQGSLNCINGLSRLESKTSTSLLNTRRKIWREAIKAYYSLADHALALGIDPISRSIESVQGKRRYSHKAVAIWSDLTHEWDDLFSDALITQIPN